MASIASIISLHTMISAFPRHVTITDNNEGPVVNIAAWLGMTMMTLAVFTRIGSKFSIVRRFAIDDFLILATMMFAIGHTVMLSVMVSNGLGRPQASLSAEVIANFQKFGYISQLLYIPALCLGKLSTLIYLRGLAPGSPFAFLGVILEVLVACWGVSAEFSIALKCSLPTPWAIITSQCFNRVIFWDTIGSFDAVTDIGIVLLPAHLVWRLKLPRTKKLLVFSIFATRILNVPLTIARLYYLSLAASSHIADQTLISYHAYLFTTIQLNTAIFTACIPFLKPFMESMSSGALSYSISLMDSSYATPKNSKFSTCITEYTTSAPRASIVPSAGVNVRMSDLPQESRLRTNSGTLPVPLPLPAPVVDDIQPCYFGTSVSSQTPLRGVVGARDSGAGWVQEWEQTRSDAGSERMFITQTTVWDAGEYEMARVV